MCEKQKDKTVLINLWHTLMQLVMEKSTGFHGKDYLPLGKEKFVTRYELCDLDFAFTITTDQNGFYYDVAAADAGDILIRLDSSLLIDCLMGKCTLFQLIVQNKAKSVLGNSQYLTYLTAKNIMMDVIKELRLEPMLEQIFSP